MSGNLCPKDFLPCCDDLCRGGGCIAMDGAELYWSCSGCGAIVSDEDMDNCTCDPWEDEPTVELSSSPDKG